MSERGKEVAKALEETNQDIKTVVPIAREIIQEIGKAVSFIIHCFKCNNKPKTPVLLRHDSVEIKQVSNSVQVQGICATCGKKVHGFIPLTQAKELVPGFELKPVTRKRKSKAIVEAEDGESKKAKVESEPAPVVTAVVGEAAEENKQ